MKQMYLLQIFNDGKKVRTVAHWYYYSKDGKLTVWLRVFGRGLYFSNNWGGHWKFKLLRKEVING